jgi:foldase protein PrsA
MNLQPSHHPRSGALLCLALLIVLLVAGCGSSSSASDPTDPAPPLVVPRGAVAIVARTPIERVSLERWTALFGHGGSSLAAARAAALSFLIKAQWLEGEAREEGIDPAVVDRLVARQLAGAPKPGAGGTHAEQALRARLDLIIVALEEHHRTISGPGAAAVAAYYRAHRSKYTLPPVRHTLLIAAPSRAAALRARAALRRGEPWAKMADRFSADSSAAVGGRYAVVAGVSAPPLVRLAFHSPYGRLLGPVAATPTNATKPDYYLLEVLGADPARLQTLAEVKSEIRETLTEARSQAALEAYEATFARRWRARTLCAPGHLVRQCGNPHGP